MEKLIASMLAVLLAATPMRAADGPAILEIKILEGEGTVYPVGTRATRGFTILVTDETGKPVPGATVSFSLPMGGPGGTFSSGSRTEIATTQGDGRVVIWGMQWNQTAGQVEIRVTAVKGQARAGTLATAFLSDAPEAKAAAAVARKSEGGGGHKWLWIALAAGAGAGLGMAGLSKGGSSGATAGAVTTPSTSIGTPTIILSRP